MLRFIKTSLALSGLILFGAGCARATEPTASVSYDGAVSQSVTVIPSPEVSMASEAVIEYKDGMFNPPILKVLTGTKVTFVNKGVKEMWPASGVHPTHQICPGFDAKKALKAGETYSFTFKKAGNCPFHNHVAPAEKGTIEAKTE